MEKITWQALEFEKHEKSGSWFAALWIVAAALVVVALLTKSVFMAILVIVAALTVSLFAAKEPRRVSFSLDDKSLTIDDKSYPLDSFDSFWVFEQEKDNLLSFETKAFRPHLKALLPKEKTSVVRLLLRASLEEKEQEESLVDALADRLRF